MSTCPSVNIEKASGSIDGPLNRSTLCALDKQFHHTLFKQCREPQIQISLANTTQVDTAGLAWLLLLIETAQKVNCQLSFVHLSDDLLKLAQLSAVDDFLTA